MKQSTWVWIIVVVVVVLGGWYLISSMSSPQTAVSPSTNTKAGLNGSPNQTNTGQQNVTPVVNVSSSPKLGSFLAAANGKTLYSYKKDTAGLSNCYGACATAWPPYSPVVNEPLTPGSGVTGVLSVITRTDGTTQLAYNGAPLYFYKEDLKAGDTKGQNISKVWFVVKP